MERSNRIGQVEISIELIHDFNLMSLFFSKFIPLVVTSDVFSKKITYKGYSPNFDELKEGEEIPVYECVVTFNKNELDQTNNTIEFKRNCSGALTGFIRTVHGKDIDFLVNKNTSNRRQCH